MKTRSNKVYHVDFKKKPQCAIACNSRNLVNLIHKCENRQPCCKVCFARYVKDKLSAAQYPIPCMFCEQQLTYNEVDSSLQTFGMKHMFEQASLQKGLLMTGEYRHCPRPNCTGGALGVKPQDLRAMCNVCQLPFCVPCQDVDHPNQTCQEAKQHLKPEEKESETVKANESKKCPKCQTFISKNKGCDHVRCVKCGYNFCWICMGEWFRGHHHRPTSDRPRLIDKHTLITLANGALASRIVTSPPLNERHYLIKQQVMHKILIQRRDAIQHLSKVINERNILFMQLKEAGIEPLITPPTVPQNVAPSQ